MFSESEIQREKHRLRRAVHAAVRDMAEAERVEGSARAIRLLTERPQWRSAGVVLLFAPMAWELDIWPLANLGQASGKTIALPRYDAGSGRYVACVVRNLASEVASGYYGIREPASHCSQLVLNRLDLALVPGVAFDPHGRRLGRGKGFYDQLLAGLSATKCGVAFDAQVVPEVPVTAHDISVNCILTPTRWLEC